jgi:4-amino-4-deoxy-L-arabinose transferase-like glycosyltransferase
VIAGAFRTRLATGWGALLATLAWLAALSWLRPLALPDEGRYVGVAWEMLRSGNWLVPTLDGLPYFHKPPLFYWITGASLSLFGMNEWAARMAPLVGAMMSAAALYAFARRWSGMSSARLALLALATQPLLYTAAQYANLDMLVAGCISVTVLALAHAALEAEQGRRARGVLALAYTFAALGLLAKGLIGIVLPGMVIVAWLLVLRRPRAILSLLWLPGIALFFLLAAPWFIAMQLRFPEFAHYFFVVQHFQRFAGSGFNNAQPLWFFPVVIAISTLPWFAWLPSAARPAYWADPQQGKLRQLMWLWIAVVTLFFSLPNSKLVGYILPVTLPLAFLIGDSARAAVEDSSRMRRIWRLSATVAVVICVGFIAFASWRPSKSTRSLATVLAREAAPQDPIVFLYDYYFDLSFYARLRQPVRVVEDWSAPSVAERDNWSKELLDASRFAPAAAPPVLLPPAAMRQIVCNANTTWVLGNQSVVYRNRALLAGATQVAQSGETVLWRVPGRGVSAGCPGTPSANSTDK